MNKSIKLFGEPKNTRKSCTNHYSSYKPVHGYAIILTICKTNIKLIRTRKIESTINNV